MRYEEFAPPANLRATVAAFWRFELGAHDPDEMAHVVPPDGTVGLAAAFGDDGSRRLVLMGPRLSALRVTVRRNAHYAGVRARPGRGAALFGVRVPAHRERVALFHELSPGRAEECVRALTPWPSGADLVERLGPVLEAWVRSGPAPDPVAGPMVDLVLASRGRLPVGTLWRGTGLSYRQALRRFEEAVGLSPKELARLVRLRLACLRALSPSSPSWAAVSAEAGFADQAHLTREFSEYFGWPPRLVREYLSRIEHVDVQG